MDGWINRCVDGRINRWMLMGGLMNEWIDGWMDGWMDGLMGGC